MSLTWIWSTLVTHHPEGFFEEAEGFLWTLSSSGPVMGDFRIQMVGLDQARSCRCDFPSPAMAGMPPFTPQHRSPRAVAISVADPGTCARRNVDAQGEFDDVKSREVEMLFEMYKSKLDALLGLFGCVHQPSFIRTSQLPLHLYPSAFIAGPKTAILCLSTPTNSFLFFFQDREQGREAAGGIPLDPGEFNFRASTALSPPPQTPKRAEFPRMGGIFSPSFCCEQDPVHSAQDRGTGHCWALRPRHHRHWLLWRKRHQVSPTPTPLSILHSCTNNPQFTSRSQ